MSANVQPASLARIVSNKTCAAYAIRAYAVHAKTMQAINTDFDVTCSLIDSIEEEKQAFDSKYFNLSRA